VKWKWQVPELARAIAAERNRCHQNHASMHAMGGDLDDAAIVGVCGEMYVARMLGLPYTWAASALQVAGDGGVDFSVPLIGRPKPLTLDVKTARTPKWLFIPRDKIERGAEALVLCKYTDEAGPTFVGWDWRSVMRKMGIIHVKKSNTYNYARPAEMLFKFPALLELLARREQFMKFDYDGFRI